MDKWLVKKVDARSEEVMDYKVVDDVLEYIYEDYSHQFVAHAIGDIGNGWMVSYGLDEEMNCETLYFHKSVSVH